VVVRSRAPKITSGASTSITVSNVIMGSYTPLSDAGIEPWRQVICLQGVYHSTVYFDSEFYRTTYFDSEFYRRVDL